MTSEPANSQKILSYFLQEASELLQQMDHELQTLRQEFSVQKVHTLMRIAHTLKGAAASVGLDAIKTVTHSLEDTFNALCSKDATLSAAVEALIFDAYECLQLLVSSLTSKADIDEARVLDRMANIVTQLQQHLGDQFGRDGYLPTSAELGFDVTQSIFEQGVNKRLNELETALPTADSEMLAALLKSQADIFIGLAESLNLPGFGDIAKTTLAALDHRPDQIIQIAQVALADYRAGYAKVLQGDRTHGGQPSQTLNDLGNLSQSERKNQSPTQLSKNHLVSSSSSKPNRAQQFWNFINRPIPGTPGLRTYKSTSQANISLEKIETPEILPSPNEEVSSRIVEEPAETLDVAETSIHRKINDSIVSTENLYTIDVEAVQPKTVTNESAAKLRAANTPNKNANTLRVSADHIELLNYMIGELMTQQNRQELHHNQLSDTLKRLFIKLDRQQQQLYELQQTINHRTADSTLKPHQPSIKSKVSSLFDPLELDQYNDLQLLVQTPLDNIIQQMESVDAIELFTYQSHQSLEKQKQLVGTLRDTLFEVRMQALDEVLQRFHQVLSRLSIQYDKPVYFEVKIHGDNVRIDRTVADQLYDPLLHLVRNAFDHGIETPEIRQQKKKQGIGLIKIEASQRGRYLTIKVSDNGQGLDIDKICQKAIENRLITSQEGETLTPEQLSNLIFEPGFSTVHQASDLSGRGIGLDVVRSQMNTLEGHVVVTSQPDQGTCFTLQIPTNLTIAKTLLCQAANRQYAIVSDTIEQIVVPESKQLSTREQIKILSWNSGDQERLVPIFSLSQTFNYSALFPNKPLDRTDANAVTTTLSTLLNPIILIRYNERLVGLEVDSLQEEQELVIHPLDKGILIADYVYGCSSLPDGRLNLVLDGAVLVETILSNLSDQVINLFHDIEQINSKIPESPYPSAPSKKTILIIDDSITVRNTLETTLQQADYWVIQAKEGTEGIKKLIQNPIDAVFCDLEMPGMNGFDFLKACQQTTECASVPIIVLSSRSSIKHQQLATELGAAAYLTKPYLGPKLLETLANAIEKSKNQLQEA